MEEDCGGKVRESEDSVYVGNDRRHTTGHYCKGQGFERARIGKRVAAYSGNGD